MTKVNKISAMLLAALAAASLLSCNKEEVAAPSDKTAIGFHSKDVWTKALVSGVNDLKGEGFVVYAKGTFSGTEDTYYFNRDVNWSTVDGVAGWNYDNLEYWLPTCTYDFRAYFPAQFPATSINKEDFSFTGFTIAPQYGNQKDILVANAQRSTSQITSAGSTVSFTFCHLLSNLNVTLKVAPVVRDKVDENGNPVDENNDGQPDQETIDALEADLTAVAFNGVAQTADYNGTWIGHGSSTAVGGNMSPAVPVTIGGVSVFGEDGLLVIPEGFETGKVKLYISANITMPDGAQMSKVWNLDVPGTTWLPNTKYRYTATLTADFNIEFDEPQVESWGEEQMNSGTVIIR